MSHYCLRGFLDHRACTDAMILSNGVRSERKIHASPGNPRLLIVEDDPTTAVFLEHALREWYRTDTVAAVASGVQQAISESYDGFLVDIGMRSERVNGIDLLELLRTLPEYADTPVIAATGFVMPGDREHLLESGFDAYLGKPFFRDDLLTTLDRFFGHRHADA